MNEDYITPACLLYRCGDREGNLEQCAALTTEVEVDDEGNITVVRRIDDNEVNEILATVSRKNWAERNCRNCALWDGDYCPTHGRVGVRDTDLSYCYHRHPAELGGKRVNNKVLLRWARYCASRASIHAMTAADAARGARAAARGARGAARYAAAAAADAAYAAYVDAADADDDAADAAARAAYAAGDEWLHCAQVLWRWIEKWGDDVEEEENDDE